MKLRNKKTGDIVEVESLYLTQTQELYLNYINEENKQKVYITDKIASFNLEWEDYEEPKEHWAIDQFGEPINVSCLSNLQLEKLHRLGNDFLSENATMKAIDKLKAWKRLKDKGFRFEGLAKTYLEMDCIEFDIGSEYLRERDLRGSELNKDLELLFGGEE